MRCSVSRPTTKLSFVRNERKQERLVGHSVTQESHMCQLIESRSYGDLYGDVPAWENALVFMRDVLQRQVHRVATASIADRRWSITSPQRVDSPCVYFEASDGSEIGCWTSGVNRLQVFAQPRQVHETMRANKTLWPFTPNAENQALTR